MSAQEARVLSVTNGAICMTNTFLGAHPGQAQEVSMSLMQEGTVVVIAHSESVLSDQSCLEPEHDTMRPESTTKVLAKCMLEYHKIS